MPVKTRTSAPIFEVLEILKKIQEDIKDIKTDITDINNSLPHHIFIPTDPEPKRPMGWLWG